MDMEKETINLFHDLDIEFFGLEEKERNMNKIKDALQKAYAAGESANTPKKIYKVNPQIGTSKYSVSFYDGVKVNLDGSEFFDLRIFKKKRDLNKFVDTLRGLNYIEQ